MTTDTVTKPIATRVAIPKASVPTTNKYGKPLLFVTKSGVRVYGRKAGVARRLSVFAWEMSRA